MASAPLHSTPDDIAAGTRAFEHFCTPALSSRRAPDHDKLVERARFHLRHAATRRIVTPTGEVQTYTFTPDAPPKASVLLVHGWTGEAAFMGAFADYLRRRGYRAVLMDMPAHGQSEGHRVSLFDCARAALEVAEALGPMRFALGHSIGAMALLATGEGHRPLPRAYPFQAYVLVSMPDAFTDVTRMYGNELGLTAAALRVFERHLEGLSFRGISDFTGTKLLTTIGKPALLLHSRDDDEVPFACGEAMASRVPGVRLEPFDGLGHRAILYAPPPVRAAAGFLDGVVAGAQ